MLMYIRGEKCGRQMALFMFWAITLKQLNSLTSTDTSICLGGCEVTLQTGVRDVPGSIPGSDKDFYVCFLAHLRTMFYNDCSNYSPRVKWAIPGGLPVLYRVVKENLKKSSCQNLHGLEPWYLIGKTSRLVVLYKDCSNYGPRLAQ